MAKRNSRFKAQKRIERFAHEYARDQNGTRAAIASGYSKKSAASLASRLLRNVKVQEIITKLTAKTCAKLEITGERVLQELAKMAFVDPRAFFDEHGNVKAIHDLDEHTAAALAGIEVVELANGTKVIGYTKKIKIADKGANLERLGRHLKLFTDRMEMAGPSTLDKLVDEFQIARGALVKPKEFEEQP